MSGIGCPPWCVQHLPADVCNPDDAGAHCGREVQILITQSGEPQWIGVQVIADEHANCLDPHIDLVAPSHLNAELAVWQARMLADLLVEMADTSLTVPAHPCPPWCLQHQPEPTADPYRHHGPLQRLQVRGPRLHTSFVATQLVGFEQPTKSPVLRVRVHLHGAEPIDVSATQSRQVAAALYDAADTVTRTVTW